MLNMELMLTVEMMKTALPEKGLFRERQITWRIAPQPLALPKAIVKQLRGLGHSLARFQDASHLLYRQSAAQRQHPWLAEMLDAGKPSWLIEAQRSKALSQAAPRIIRPDLLLAQDALSITELDSVPGGMGIMHFLSRIYSEAGFDILGGADGMRDAFRYAHPDGAQIAVSAESSDYLPEMEYFADELGAGFSCAAAESLRGDESSIYRFFELFDTEQIPAARALIEASGRGEVNLSSPALPHLEEKAWLALFHYPALQPFWQQQLRGNQLDSLRRLIPRAWILDPSPLPPQASIPWLNLHSWQDVANLSQRERRLVLKISGFNELAWGARGVHIGHDMPATAWKESINHALNEYPRQLWTMQEFRDTSIIEHPYYDEAGEIVTMQGRVRLCPYYFRSPDAKETILGGCLATIVPADKKKIHGMKNAILVPCSLA